MIIGIGTDLADIRRIESSLQRFGDRFLDRVFTQGEQAAAYARARPANGLALRFAAKEACSKALGTGFRKGVFMRDMAVANLPSGKPYMILTGGALERLRTLTPPSLEARVEVSLSDEYPLAQAFVVIWAGPR